MKIHRSGFRVVSCLQVEGGGSSFNRHTAEIRRANKMVWEKITPPELRIGRPTEETPNIGETFSIKWHQILAPVSLVWGEGNGCAIHISAALNFTWNVKEGGRSGTAVCRLTLCFSALHFWRSTCYPQSMRIATLDIGLTVYIGCFFRSYSERSPVSVRGKF